MKYLLFTVLIILAVGYYFYQRTQDFFKGLIVTYQILGTQLIQGTQLLLRITVFNTKQFSLTINNPVISLFDGNGNLLVKLDLASEIKRAKLQQGVNQYDFKILEKLQFNNLPNLNNIKTFFSANIYGIEFTKQIPTKIL